MKILKNYDEKGIWKESDAFSLNVLFLFCLKTLGNCVNSVDIRTYYPLFYRAACSETRDYTLINSSFRHGHESLQCVGGDQEKTPS